MAISPAAHPTAASARSQDAIARARAHPTLMLLIIAGASLMIALDATIVNVALPSMGRYFERGPTGMTWAVNAYTLTFGGLLLLGGRCGDFFGRRRTLITGLALFALGSLAAGLATSFEFLLAGRVLEGVGAAIAAPTALALVTTEYREGPPRHRAIAVYAAVSGAGAGFGLLLGGLLTDYLTWRWVLFVNVPIGLGLIVATYYYLGESERAPRHLDIFGSLLSVGGVAGIVYGLVNATNHGWQDSTTVLALVVSGGLLVAFVVHEARFAQEPITPIGLFRDRNRSSAYVITLIGAAGLFGMFYFITFFAQDVLGYSPLKAGLAFLPAVAFISISAQASALLLPRVGPKLLLVIGTLLQTGALLWLSTIDADSTYLGTVLPSTFVFGAGLGAALVPLTAVVTSRLAPGQAGQASSVLNVGQQLGGALGLAVLLNVATNQATDDGKTEGIKLISKYGLVSEHFGNFVALAQSALSGTPAPSSASHDAIAQQAIDRIGAHAAGTGFLTAASFAGAALLLALVGISRKRTVDGTQTLSALDDVDREPAA